MVHQSTISVKVSKTDVAVTNFPGVVPLANLADRFGVFDDLDALLPKKARARGFSNGASVFDLMCIAWSGGQCIDDLAQLRADSGLCRLLGRRPMAPSTAHDFLKRIRYDGLDALGRVHKNLLGRVAKQMKVTQATLDCDASLFVSSGKDARMSYKGERGYMPMLAFWEELGMVMHDDFRNGNASPASDALEFLKHTVAQLPPEVTGIKVRSDSAWYQRSVMDYCEEEGYDFCIVANRDKAVKQAMTGLSEDEWQRINLPVSSSGTSENIREWALETVHTLNTSKHAYRLIVIRKERSQHDLFEGTYTYHALITNMELPLEKQIAWYRKRGQCENQIKELKWDFALRVLPSGDFFINAVYLRIITLSYNLFIALKELTLPETYKKLHLKTLRFRLLAIPALITRHARRLWLKLPRGHPGQKIFRAFAQ